MVDTVELEVLGKAHFVEAEDILTKPVRLLFQVPEASNYNDMGRPLRKQDRPSRLKTFGTNTCLDRW